MTARLALLTGHLLGYVASMGDTSIEAERVRIHAIRVMTPAQRLRQAFDLSEIARRLALAGLRRRHPDRSDAELVAIYAGRVPPTERHAQS